MVGDPLTSEVLSPVKRVQRTWQILRVLEELSAGIVDGEEQVAGTKFLGLCGAKPRLDVKATKRFDFTGRKTDMHQSGLGIPAFLVKFDELLVVDFNVGHTRFPRIGEFESLLETEGHIETSGFFVVGDPERNVRNSCQVQCLCG